MSPKTKSALRPALSMIGAIIGAGVFGIPAMFGRLGVFTGSLVFLVIALIVLAIHFLMLDIVLRDPRRGRLPGYVKHILGHRAGSIAKVTFTFQIIGACFAYVVLGGQFFQAFFLALGVHLPLSVWQFIFWLFGALCVVWGIAWLSKIEAYLTWGLIALLVMISGFAVSHLFGGLGIVTAGVGTGHILPSIGVFLFALVGYSSVPDIYEMAGRNAHRARISIFWGSLGAAFLSWIFGVTVYLAMRYMSVTQFADPMSLSAVLPLTLRWALPVMGFLAVITSFTVLVFDLKTSYIFDSRWKPWEAWALTLGSPLALVILFQMSSFLTIVNVIGSFFVAINGVFIALAARKLMSDERKHIPQWWRETLPLVVAGVLLIVITQRVLAFFY